MWSEILVVVVLVLLNGFFAMSELALLSSRRGELQRLADHGRRGARAALELIDDPSRLLSAVQIGITLVGIVAGAYSGATLGREFEVWLAEAVPPLAEWSGGIAMVLVVGAITYLSLVIGELVPKRVALHHSEAIAVAVAPIMRVVARAGGPVVWLLRVSTEAVLKAIGLRDSAGKGVTEEEVRALIAEGALTGVFAPGEKEMLDRVLRLADRTVASIMTPRPDIVWIDSLLPADELRRHIAASPHSRLPVGRGSVDELEGLLDSRVVLSGLLSGRPFQPLAELVEPLVVHENATVPRLLDMMKQSGAPLAVVVDEYGVLEGLVTMTDILEAIAGELPSQEPGEEPAAVRRDDGSWLIDGGLGIEEVEALTGLSGLGEEGDFHTLAGFVLARLHHLPEIGERFAWHGWAFEVIDMDGRRIDRMLIEPPSPAHETYGSGI